MASIPEPLDGHVTWEVECLDRLYLNGYIGRLATSGGLVTSMREQLGKPIPSPVVLGQVTEKFPEAVKAMAERERIPVYQFDHKEQKDDVANDFVRHATCLNAPPLAAPSSRIHTILQLFRHPYPSVSKQVIGRSTAHRRQSS